MVVIVPATINLQSTSTTTLGSGPSQARLEYVGTISESEAIVNTADGSLILLPTGKVVFHVGNEDDKNFEILEDSIRDKLKITLINVCNFLTKIANTEPNILEGNVFCTDRSNDSSVTKEEIVSA
jgi:hypothetical protein